MKLLERVRLKKRFEAPRSVPLHRYGSVQVRSVELDLEGRLTFVTDEARWAYALVFVDLLEMAAVPTNAGPVVIRIQAEVREGVIGIGVIDPHAGGEYISMEPHLHADQGRTCVDVLLEASPPGSTLVFRNTALSSSSSATLHSIQILPANQLSAAEIKSLRSRRYRYWHYSFDLGDGISVEASKPGLMQAHQRKREILFGLLSDHFGSLNDRCVLDAACSSGYHSFELARQGARVTAIDIDSAQIEQARFVQTCRGESRNPIFQCQDLLGFTAPDMSFDLIYCAGLFYHLRDPVGGAAQLYRLCREGAIVQSALSTRNGDVLELADAERYSFCFKNEFAFVPTSSMLRKIFTHVGFREIHEYSPQTGSADASQTSAGERACAHARECDMAYFVVKK
jgi:SAM-dependent methyltransferase